MFPLALCSLLPAPCSLLRTLYLTQERTAIGVEDSSLMPMQDPRFKSKGLIPYWIWGLVIILWLLSMPTAFALPWRFGSANITCSHLISLTKTRPQTKDIPLQVSLDVDVLDILKVDETEQTVTLDLLLKMKWQDPRLNINIKDKDPNYCLVDPQEVWHPHPDILNSISISKNIENLVYLNREDRASIYIQFLTVKINNGFDFRRFPFDRQKISVKFIFLEDNLVNFNFLESLNTAEINSQSLSISSWSLDGVENKKDIISSRFSDLELRYFEYDLIVKRNLAFPVWKMMFPISLITFMPYLVFWLHPTLIVPQITLSVITIISVIAFQSNLADQIPHISYLTGADKFIIGSMLMIFWALLQTVIGLNLNESGQVSLALSLDLWMRWLYPLLFALVIIFAFVI